jgi:hypothetical protein
MLIYSNCAKSYNFLNLLRKYKDKISRDYYDRVIGLNFLTKNSLNGGIELADLISYVSFQSLRFKYNRTVETEGFSDETKQILKKTRLMMRKKLKIEIVEVTNISLPKYKKS